MDISARAFEVIAKQVGMPAAALDASMHLVNDLGTDELARIEIVLALEEAFDIVIDDDAIEGFQTLGDIVQHLERRLS